MRQHGATALESTSRSQPQEHSKQCCVLFQCSRFRMSRKISLLHWSGVVGIYKSTTAFDTSLVCSVLYLSVLALSFKRICPSLTDPTLSFASKSLVQFHAVDTGIISCSIYDFGQSWPVLHVTSVVLTEICNVCKQEPSSQSDWISLKFFQCSHSTCFQIHYSTFYHPK